MLPLEASRQNPTKAVPSPSIYNNAENKSPESEDQEEEDKGTSQQQLQQQRQDTGLKEQPPEEEEESEESPGATPPDQQASDGKVMEKTASKDGEQETPEDITKQVRQHFDILFVPPV